MKISFFFGSGAEVGYGLPNGGKFAIDLFRQDVSELKENFRSELSQIDELSNYATEWLPTDYENKRIHAFGKNEFTNIIESSLEYRKDEIIRRFNDIDNEADSAINNLGIDIDQLRSKFGSEIGHEYGEKRYSHAIRINKMLADKVRIFSSEFYSALLDAIKDPDIDNRVQRYASAILELLVGSYGQDLVKNLNQELFENAPDDIPIFDDLSGMFRLEFNRVGQTALELLLNERPEYPLDVESSLSDLLCAISQEIIEEVFTTVLDYQALIDQHYRYLFSPKTEWAKFTKMVIFLRATREYIIKSIPEDGIGTDGFYHDLLKCDELGINIEAVGTSNYNNLFERIDESFLNNLKPVHLNGGVNDFYNAYKNSVLNLSSDEDPPKDQIHVPFILTQSGLKPLTSVDMSRRYVDLFDSFKDSDTIVVVGYGFNIDDSHINGLFRELVEGKGKRLIWVNRKEDGVVENQKRELVKKLRLSQDSIHLIDIIPVDSNTRKTSDRLWIEEVMNRVS